MKTIRCRDLNHKDGRSGGSFVLYWMVAARRASWNFALDRALQLAGELGQPVLIFEALRADYPWANARLHRFAVQGMVSNRESFGRAGLTYYPYVEPVAGAGKGLLEALAAFASAIVTDDTPGHFDPNHLAAAASRVPVRLEAVDSNGVLPLRATEQVFSSAYQFRRFLHRALPEHLLEMPAPKPLSGRKQLQAVVPTEIAKRWPEADLDYLTNGPVESALAMVDGTVGPVETSGGEKAARSLLRRFLARGLAPYGEARNVPDADGTSGLSPYLHFGHISAHEVVESVLRHEDWSPARADDDARGKREGWWGLSPSAESFLDELITWRELGYNMAAHAPDYERYESLPAWARRTLAEHAADRRPHLYSLEEFEMSATHDPLWNAAQRQLVTEGRIHGYLRMLWGKKILEWTRSPEEALNVMVELNNTYALDGRDPNSYSGIFWVLGRYDRPWGPERPVFGKIRYMSSENTARKVGVSKYMERYSQD